MLERRLVIMDGKMKLYGFNNLTKSLSFNIYDVCYAKTQREQKDYISYIDEQYNSDRLTKILTHVTEMIGAKVLNISKQDYEPQGASVTILVATFLTIISIGENSGISPITGAVVGSLLGFLLFNVYPAKVFMGDTGSLALGGFVSASAFMMQIPLFIPIIGLIYLVEVLSVIMQVSYFKATHGKRIFRMAPIHHHFELGGWSETRVVAVFSIVTALLCLVAYLGL